MGFEKISTNCDVLIYIYKLLHFGDQLRLAQVSQTLRRVFENFIWTLDYRSLTICDAENEDYVVTNATNVHRLVLARTDFEEFLRFYASKVQELTADSPLDLKQFKNLTHLVCDTYHCGSNVIQLLAKQHPDLESLQLRGRSCFDNFMVDKVNIESLLQMKRLKRLDVDVFHHSGIAYKDYCEIIFKLKLEVLNLGLTVRPAKGDEATEYVTSSISVPLKELAISTTFEPRKWSSGSFTSFLNIFANLSILTVHAPDDGDDDNDAVTDEILAIIATSCHKLEKLCLKEITFANIERFCLPPSLTELYLDACEGLTYNNLKQILTTTNITKCSSNCTAFRGVFEDFRISPLIETLALHKVDMCAFQSAYDKNENLKNLTWFHSMQCRYADFITADLPLASCPNLETLRIDGSQIALESVLQLKHLRNLSTFLMSPIQWSYIKDLLQHPTLRELSLEISSRQTASLDLPVEGFATNVIDLNIDYFTFECALDFWLDLFCQNVNMKLTIIDRYLVEMDFVLAVIKHHKFPTFLKTIDFRGYTLECDNLRRNIDVKIYPTLDLENEGNDECCLVLCRNYTQRKMLQQTSMASAITFH